MHVPWVWEAQDGWGMGLAKSDSQLRRGSQGLLAGAGGGGVMHQLTLEG